MNREATINPRFNEEAVAYSRDVDLALTAFLYGCSCGYSVFESALESVSLDGMPIDHPLDPEKVIDQISNHIQDATTDGMALNLSDLAEKVFSECAPWTAGDGENGSLYAVMIPAMEKAIHDAGIIPEDEWERLETIAKSIVPGDQDSRKLKILTEIYSAVNR